MTFEQRLTRGKRGRSVKFGRKAAQAERRAGGRVSSRKGPACPSQSRTQARGRGAERNRLQGQMPEGLRRWGED